MALIRDFAKRQMDRNSVHSEIEATYTTFQRDGRVFIQIDSYGRESREITGKKSQTFQLDREGAKALYDILRTEFNF